MTTARKVEHYMRQHGVHYDVVTHPHSHSSIETAELAHVPGERLAKSVVLEDRDGYVMAVLPSTHQVKLGKLRCELNRNLRLANEDELKTLFSDCELGAVPPLGLAYGMTTVVDDALAQQPEVYFEAGDHEQLIRVNGDAFRTIMEHAGHGRFSHRVWSSGFA
jgi:Ala-tRNA(Pro) deacylase